MTDDTSPPTAGAGVENGDDDDLLITKVAKQTWDICTDVVGDVLFGWWQ